jgi:hypothetical protein
MPVVHIPSHLDILDKGVDHWNDWRERNPHVIPQLDGAYFPPETYCGINLRNASLIGAEFDESYLRLADFSGALLNRAVFNNVRLDGSLFARASLVCGRIVCSNLEYSNIEGANLQGCDLSRSNLMGASLVGADLGGANLAFCQLAGTNLASARLSGACIEDWAISDKTQVEGIECTHLFRSSEPQELAQVADGNLYDIKRLRDELDRLGRKGEATFRQFSQRVPRNGGDFQEGEFESIVRALCALRNTLECGDLH